MGRQQGRKGGAGKGAFRAGKEGKEGATGEKRGRDNDVWHMDSRDMGQLGSALLDKYYRQQTFSYPSTATSASAEGSAETTKPSVWAASYECFKTPLPQATRVNKNHPDRRRVAQLLVDEFAHNGFPYDKDLTAVAVTDAAAAKATSESDAAAAASAVLRPLTFIPEGLGMQVPLSRGDIKRGADFKRLKRVLAAFNEAGILTRQETVSMVPPLMLDVRPGMRVLDMCAAPGSKTSQLLEALVSGGYGNTNDGASSVSAATATAAASSAAVLGLDAYDTTKSRGVVVANDVNIARIDILTHQTGRAPHCHPNLIITCNDATGYPLITKPEDKFDRVLCDVMCSGDGTLRKSLDLWSRWNPLQGADLHPSQLRTLLRGMSLVKAGGIVVYSTCSLNPIEDEAVVAEALLQAKGAFELVDPLEVLGDEGNAYVPTEEEKAAAEAGSYKICARLAAGLRYSPGVTSWKLATKDGEAFFGSYEEAAKHRKEVMNDKGFQFRSTMFPPSATPIYPAATAASGDDAAPAATPTPTNADHLAAFAAIAEATGEAPTIECLHLERSMRILPHLQDSGGFFVAALRCKRDFSATEQSATRRFRQQDEQREAAEANSARKTYPYVPVAGSEIEKTICSTMNIDPAAFPFDRLFIRREGFTQVTGKHYFAADAEAAERDGGFDSDGKPITAGRPPRTAKLFLATPEAAEMMRILPPNANIKQIGLKAFETYGKYTADKFRVFAESLDTVLPYFVRQQQQSAASSPDYKRSFVCRVTSPEALEWLIASHEKSNGRSTVAEFCQRVEVCDVVAAGTAEGSHPTFTTRKVTDAAEFKAAMARKSFAVLCPLYNNAEKADTANCPEAPARRKLQETFASFTIPLAISAELDDAQMYVQVKVLPHQLVMFRLALNGSADDPNAVAAAAAKAATAAAEKADGAPANPKSRERDDEAVAEATPATE